MPNTAAIDFNTRHLTRVSRKQDLQHRALNIWPARRRSERALFFLLQPAASFHSARLMSDTKANVSCEIPA